tara:strand:- start:445 stop:828 length:384 start_codon:yes stop_codon:yes gene_type:complete
MNEKGIKERLARIPKAEKAKRMFLIKKKQKEIEDKNEINMTNAEYIKVVVSEFCPEQVSIKIKSAEMLENAQDFLEKEFKGLECDECKEESKGTVLFYVNTENNGAILYCKDFCCYDFELKTKETLK